MHTASFPNSGPEKRWESRMLRACAGRSRWSGRALLTAFSWIWPPTALAYQPQKSYLLNDDLPTIRKTPKYPNPDPYDGDREALEGFVFKLKAKLRSNKD